MPLQVPEDVKRSRVARLLALAEELKSAFLARFQGRVMPVLWEASRPGDDGSLPLWEGLTDNYIRVFARCGEDLRNRILPARLACRRPNGFWGEPLAVATAKAQIREGRWTPPID